MYQTRASVESDVPAAAATPMDDLDAVIAALDGIEPVVPRRTTFYGSQEVWVREPAGNLVGFAEFGNAEAES